MDGGAALGRRAQGAVHLQADGVLDAQDPHGTGRGPREGREREGDPGLDPGRENGWANGYMVLRAAKAGAQPRATDTSSSLGGSVYIIGGGSAPSAPVPC